MSVTPLRNGKGVNKPFRSPFSKTNTPKKNTIENNSRTLEPNDTTLCQTDLEALKKKVEQKEQYVNDLKRSLLYRKKNKAEDLEADIEKWILACQDPLIDYQKELQGTSGQPISIAQILSALNIDPNLIRFSADDESFT